MKKSYMLTEPGYEISVYDGKNLTNYNSGSSDYKTNGVTKESKPFTDTIPVAKVTEEERNQLKGTSIESRVIKEENGEKSFLTRIDPAYMGIARTSLMPEDIAMGLLENDKNWDIVGQEKVAGINTVIIKGVLNKYYSEKWGAESFILNVDPKTGILLVMEAHDTSGNVTDMIRTHSIQIDGQINEKLFTDFVE